MTRAEIEKSLALWSEREARYRRNRNSKKKGDPRRYYWFKKLKQAVAMVDKRTKDLAGLGVTTVSKPGLDLVKEFEGFARTRPGKPDVAYPYQDPKGVWTIGYGETRGVSRFTRPWTRAQATERMRLRITRDYLAPVLAYCKAVGFMPSQREADAFASLAYNLGTGVFARGRTIGDAVASGDRARIADAFLVYSEPNNPAIHAGLLRRRKRERAMFLGQ